MNANNTQNFDKYLPLVGRMNHAWVNTEGLLIHLIAGLSKSDIETAAATFVTLRTSDARLDLVQRLARLDHTPSAQRDDVLAVITRLKKARKLRDRYSHCIYDFDPSAKISEAYLTKLGERTATLKPKPAEPVGQDDAKGVTAAIKTTQAINQSIWTLIREYRYPAAPPET